MTSRKKVATTGFSLVLAYLLGMSVFLYLNFTTVVVSGDSMEPTYRSGEKLLASRAYWLIGSIGPKDVVVIRDPARSDSYIIKRVLAVGGQQIDSENVPFDYLLSQGPFIVPEGHLYVIGDNKEVSEDSRRFGPVRSSDVIGKVVHVGAENAPAFGGLAAGVGLVVILLVLWVAVARTEAP